MQDITFVWTPEGELNLAVMIDCYSRKIGGWSMSSRMRTSLVCDAFTIAISQQQPKAGLIVHSDQGVQYASKDYHHLMNTRGFTSSICTKGGC